MIGAFVLQTVVFLVSLLFFWLPVVDTLPTIAGFDVDSALVSVFSTLRGIFALIPPLQVVWNALLIYYGFVILLMMIPLYRWLIGLIRGSGS